MLRNYLIVAWRNLSRNKSFSAITIIGLALGVTCSLMIMMWVHDERSMDAFHTNGKQLFQVYERNYFDGKVTAHYPTQGLLGQELKKSIPEIEYATGLEYAAAPGSQTTFEAGGKINKMNGFFAGEDFFKMFSFPLIQGNAQTALTTYEAIAISRKMAEQFFGSADKAIGKLIRVENTEDLQVTAVFENIPSHSSLQFDFLMSWVAFVKQNSWVNNWGNTSPSTFIQLRKDADAGKTEAKIKDFIYRFQEKQSSFVMELALQPFTERYLHSNFKEGRIEGGRIEYVRLFTVVAIIVLLIACINFMNLATARSVKRAKEVGIRKVVGAMQGSLIRQFIGEAILLAFFSTIIALAICEMLLPSFNTLTGKTLALPLSQLSFWAVLIGVIFVTGIVAGSYPALFLSSLKPVKVLKSSLQFRWKAVFFRKTLVVFQFALSTVLIVSMIVIYRQMDYIQSKNLGYNRENLLYIPIEGELVKKYHLFKEQAVKTPGVLTVSKMRNSPTVIMHHTGSISWPGKDPNLTVPFADAVVGYDFAKTLDIKLKEGRDFSKEFRTDSASYLLNETAVEKMGLTDPIGKTVNWGNRAGKVVGVMEDFHFNSIHHAIEPLIVRLDENWGWGTILVRVKGDQTREAIARLEKLCKQLNPKFPFAYHFSDEEYTRLYRTEQVVSKLSTYFAILAIFISCLGLFGLAAFTATQRTKEIGVRKVLGASVPNILALLTTNFLKPVAIAIVIAIPVSQYVMSRWLGGYAYKIEMEWWMFAAAGALAILIALITVSFQAVRAAVANPVKSLRVE